MLRLRRRDMGGRMFSATWQRRGRPRTQRSPLYLKKEGGSDRGKFEEVVVSC